MSEKERMTGVAPDESGADPQEKELRGLCEAAYLPLRPSPRLRQRVAELATRPDAAPRRGGWPEGWRGWAPAASAGAAALALALLGLVVTQSPEPSRDRSRPPSMGVAVPRPPRSASGSRPAAPVSLRASGDRPEPGKNVPGAKRGTLTPESTRLAPSPHRMPPVPPAAVERPAVRVAQGKQETTADPPSLAIPGPPSPIGDDLAYVNPDPAGTVRHWVAATEDEWDRIEARVRRTVRVRDDFVQIPFPRIAAASARQMAAAVEQYKKEAAVVDPRLSREVTLQVKATAFADLCDQLRTATDISLVAGRSVADEKATIFCAKRPLREIMRGINQVFGFTWLRSGEEGKYRYELVQDLRSQLAEEELRNKDLNEALVDLDGKMAEFRPSLETDLAALKQQRRQAAGPEAERLRMLTDSGGLAALRVYYHLTPDQLTAMRNGRELRFGYSPWHAEHLPQDWRKPMLETLQMAIARVDGEDRFWHVGEPGSTLVADHPAAMPSVNLKINRSELGEVALEAGVGVSIASKPGWPGIAHVLKLAVGQSPSSAKPANRKRNAALKSDPVFRRAVSVRPAPSCPLLKSDARSRAAKEAGEAAATGARRGETDKTEAPHVTSADVWEAVYKATDLPIIADFYTQIYPLSSVTVERAPLFDALCRVADELGVGWRREGGFLLCRSTRFFWNRQKEVPNRLLVQWQQHRRQNGGLPLDAVLAMASLPDPALDSSVIAPVIEHCGELPEWSILGGEPRVKRPLRSFARFVATLNPEQRQRARQPNGLPVTDLLPVQQQELARVLIEEKRATRDLAGVRLMVGYAPAGWYVWKPLVEYALRDEALRWPLVAGKSAEATLAVARRFYPRAQPSEIERTQGELAITLLPEMGLPIFGAPRVRLLVPARP